MSSADDAIEAAGGVLWRADGTDGRLFAIVHRPKYDDWSLPKGKLDPGETHQQAALREVEEETGWVADLGDELGTIDYQHRDRPKRVHYWAMLARRGAFAPNAEVDELRWLPRAEAHELLTYSRDREVLERFAATPVQVRPAREAR